MIYLYLIAGFLILLISGDLLVRSGADIAKRFKISTLVVGVTIVSMGTSAPEFVVSVQAALSGHPDIAIGNVIGSNIANIALVLAITMIILPLPVGKNSLIIDWPIMMFASMLVFMFMLNGYIQFSEGIIFVVLLVVFVYGSIRRSRKENAKLGHQSENPRYTLFVSILLVLMASLGLYFGSKWLVEGAQLLAVTLHVPESVISVSIIAFGTSVPELATSIMAAIKKETDISVGNIIGSNIFNIFGILGVTSLVKKIEISREIIHFHIYWMLGISLLLFFFMLPYKRARLNRWEGIVFLMLYVLFIFKSYGG